MNDALEVAFDFGERDGDDDAEAPDFTGQEPLGACPKCSSRVFELPHAYVCEKAVGPDKTCDFRSGRVILQRPVERAQMQKLLATGKTDLLQFVSARTKRGFSAYLVRQPDGKIGFEFEAKDASRARGARAGRTVAALRVLGAHPQDGKPVELHAGRYGPYVKHGDVNATLPDRERVNDLSLDEALALLAAKAERADSSGTKTATRRPPARTTAARPAPPRKTAAAPPAKPATTKRAAKIAPRTPAASAPTAPPKKVVGRATPRTGTRGAAATPRKRGK
jgi:hypothetical protein